MTATTATTEPTDELHERLLRHVGGTSGAPRVAPDPVNEPMIRHWCLALGDANPAYTDPVAAAASRFGGIVAPPTMIQAWTHHDRRFPGGDEGANAEELLVAELGEAGYTGVVATGCHYRFTRPLRPGDRTTYQAVIRTVSPRRRTRLGEGYFITAEVTYRDQEDREVATMAFTTLRFRPEEPT